MNSSKFQRLFQFLFPVLGIASIVLIAGLMYWWESYGRANYLFEDVAVFKQDVNRGTVVTRDMLTTMKFQKSELLDDRVTDLNQILNRETTEFVPKKAQLDTRMFEVPALVTDDKHFDFKIPNDWIYAVPNTLRRKDTILIFEVTQDVLPKVTATISKDKSNPNNTTVEIAAQVQALSGNKDPILKAAVSYVKDAANREVVTVSKEDRIDGSSSIKDVEINVTVDEYQKIQDAIKRGSKLVLMYKEGIDRETVAGK